MLQHKSEWFFLWRVHTVIDPFSQRTWTCRSSSDQNVQRLGAYQHRKYTVSVLPHLCVTLRYRYGSLVIPFINGEKFGTEWKLNISKQGLDRKCFLAMIYKSASLAYGSLNARYDRVKDAQSLRFGHCCRTCKPLVNSFESFFDAPNCLSSRPVLVCEVNPWLVNGSANDLCGGSDRLSFLGRGAQAPSQPVITPKIGNWSSIGCYS